MTERTDVQRAHLRRILASFVVVIVLLPLVALGGTWAFVLLPLVLVAAFALREALRLRADVRAASRRD